jgi:hypothetical protein
VSVKYQGLKENFAWKGMKKDVHQFVQTCQTSIQAKADRARYPRKLQPMLVPFEVGHTISMDFIKGMP